jgi:group I intron endonuclease
MIGIYKIVNKINNKVYIGESVDIDERWISHKEDLRNNEHHSCKLQADYNLYGEDNFKYEIIETLAYDIDSYKGVHYLVYREDYYIRKYDSFNNGYNCEYTLDEVMNKRKPGISNIKLDVQILKAIISQGENYCLYKKGHPKYKKEVVNNYDKYIKVLDLFEKYINDFEAENFITTIFIEFKHFNYSKANSTLRNLGIADKNNIIIIDDIGLYNKDSKIVANKQGLNYLLNQLRKYDFQNILSKEAQSTNIENIQ